MKPDRRVKPLRLAALISGGGRTLMNIADHVDSGALNASIELVIASRPGIQGIELSRGRGFNTLVVARGDYPDVNALDDAIWRQLRERRIDLVCLCGYLRLLRIDEAFRWRVMNIHPALLPDFGGPGMHGERVHAAVLAAAGGGRSVSGCTVHLVDEHYDHGPNILQRTCPVLPNDDVHSLAARVFEQECIAYPEAIRLFGEDRMRVEGDRVAIVPAGATAESEKRG